MPCNSDYMNPDYHEVNHSKVRSGLDELAGRTVKDSYWEGYHPSVYCEHTSKEELDIDTRTLCEALSKLGKKTQTLSLELQLWWREHQKADKRREKENRKKWDWYENDV